MKTRHQAPVQVAFVTHDEDELLTARYWKSKSPRERLEALALLRSQKHPDTHGTRPRIQRVCRIVDVPWRHKDLGDLEALNQLDDA